MAGEENLQICRGKEKKFTSDGVVIFSAIYQFLLVSSSGHFGIALPSLHGVAMRLTLLIEMWATSSRLKSLEPLGDLPHSPFSFAKMINSVPMVIS